MITGVRAQEHVGWHVSASRKAVGCYQYQSDSPDKPRFQRQFLPSFEEV